MVQIKFEDFLQPVDLSSNVRIYRLYLPNLIVKIFANNIYYTSYIENTRTKCSDNFGPYTLLQTAIDVLNSFIIRNYNKEDEVLIGNRAKTSYSSYYNKYLDDTCRKPYDKNLSHFTSGIYSDDSRLI